MNEPSTITAGAKTFYADDALWNQAKAYVEKTPKLKSVSSLIEKLLVREIRANGKKVGVKLPPHFLTK
jgi:hypothetical protein